MYFTKEERRKKNEERQGGGALFACNAKLSCLALFFFIFSFFTVNLFGQTAAQLETVLAAPAVTCAQAASFVLEGASGAFERAVQNGWLKKASPDDPITLGQLSFLMTKAFDLKGGLMYRIAPGPRYAYRAMVSQSCIQGIADPSMNVSGERFLLILGRALDAQGGEQ